MSEQRKRKSAFEILVHVFAFFGKVVEVKIQNKRQYRFILLSTPLSWKGAVRTGLRYIHHYSWVRVVEVKREERGEGKRWGRD